VALLAAQSCSSSSRTDVVAADGALCDITKRLAADQLRVTCLLEPEDDPHQLQLSPEQTRQLRQARLVLINGYDLTPALQNLPGAMKVAEIAVPNSPVLSSINHKRDPSDHGHKAVQQAEEHQHSHGEQDPHVWHDPRQAAAVTALISQQLQRVAPNAAAQITNRAKAMQESLQRLHQWNLNQFSRIKGPRILASGHRSFASLARAYKLQELPVIDATSNSDALRPQAMADTVRTLQSKRVRNLWTDQIPPPKNLARISSLSGVPIVPQALLADSGGASLMITLTRNTCLIVDALGGPCDRAEQAALIRTWDAIR